MRLNCRVNGEDRQVESVWEGESLLYVLRERLGLPGSKNACEQGECGSCSVYLDGVLVCACLVLAGQAEGREVVPPHDLLARTPSPADPEIREALAGNLCRCTGYGKVLDAVRLAAGRLGGEVGTAAPGVWTTSGPASGPGLPSR